MVIVSDTTLIIAKRRGSSQKTEIPNTGVSPKRKGRSPKNPQPPPNINSQPEPSVKTRVVNIAKMNDEKVIGNKKFCSSDWG
jgi:hypothetical protein